MGELCWPQATESTPVCSFLTTRCVDSDRCCHVWAVVNHDCVTNNSSINCYCSKLCAAIFSAPAHPSLYHNSTRPPPDQVNMYVAKSTVNTEDISHLHLCLGIRLGCNYLCFCLISIQQMINDNYSCIMGVRFTLH